jgi:HYDIN/CFA65/VesB family protein/centrosomal CEP192-like protein
MKPKYTAIRKLSISLGVHLIVLGALASAQISPPFTQCPPVGADSSCAILIVVTDLGVGVLEDPSQGPFDDAEDVLVGVLNYSNGTLISLPLVGPGLPNPNPPFAFDGDGLCPWLLVINCYWPHPTNYEGQTSTGGYVVFNHIDPTGNSGTVNFVGGSGLPGSTPGLPPKGSAYFSLEGTALPNSAVPQIYIQLDVDKKLPNSAMTALATAKDTNGAFINMQQAAQSLGFDHFNWLQYDVADNLLHACSVDMSPEVCAGLKTFNGTIPTVPTLDPPHGGWAYQYEDTYCPASSCDFVSPIEDNWDMYWDEYFGEGLTISINGNDYLQLFVSPTNPFYLTQYRVENELPWSNNKADPSQAYGFSFSDQPVSADVVPGTTQPQSFSFVTALVGVTGTCNVAPGTSSDCAYWIFPGSTFQWTTTGGQVGFSATPGGPLSLMTPSGSIERRAQYPDDVPVNPLDLTGVELENSLISVDQFLALANLTRESLAANGGGISSISVSLVPSEQAALQTVLVPLSPSNVTFTKQQVLTSSTPQSVTLTNSSGTPLTIYNIGGTFNGVTFWPLTGTDPRDYVVTTTTCPFTPATLAPNANCTINVTFRPTATGLRTAAIPINDSAVGNTQYVALAGTGTDLPTVTLSTSNLAFGNQQVATTSVPQAVTITNTSSFTLNFTSIAASGDYTQTNTCGASVAGGQSCTISLAFEPSTAGSRPGTLTITDDGTDSPQTVVLAGTGLGIPIASLAPASLSFGTQQQGISSGSQTVILSNPGSAALFINSVSTTGNFAITSNNCGTSLAPGGSCQLGVSFTPQSTGTLTGTLTISDNSSTGSMQTVILTGTGLGIPIASLAPVSLSFGTQQQGISSGSQTVILSNPGSAALSINSVSTTGNFAITSNNCGTALAPGGSCQIGVSFTPLSTGSLTGTLTVSDNSSTGSTQTVSLSGTGLAYSPNLLNFAVYATGSGCGAITISGGGFTDSFNSSQGTYSQTKQNATGNVGVTGNINLSSSGTINGTVSALNTSVGQCSNGTPGISLSGQAKVTAGYILLNSPLLFPNPVAVPPGTQDYVFTKSGSLSPGSYHNVSVQSGATLTLSPGTYNVNSITLSGNSILALKSGGQVIIYLAGNGVSTALNASGGSISNPSGVALNLQLIYGGTLPTLFSGGSMAYGLVYMPNSAVTLSGSGGWYGAMVVRTLNDSGGSAIHYDRSL